MKVKEISSFLNGAPAEMLYETARKVFSIPPLEDLHDPEKVGDYLSSWGGNDVFSGPVVLYDHKHEPVLILTESSKREIWLEWSPAGFLRRCRIIFGESFHAASEVIAHLGSAKMCVTLTDGSVRYDGSVPWLVHPEMGRMAWDDDFIARHPELVAY